MQVNKCLPLEKIWLFTGIISINIKLKKTKDKKWFLILFNKKDDSLCKEFKIRNESKIEQNYTDIKKWQEFSV